MSTRGAARQVTFTVIAGDGQLDGALKGALLFSAPARWTITIRFVDASSSGTRYACVLSGSPAGAGPAIAAERAPHPRHGLAPGRAGSFTFAVPAPGLYRIAAISGATEPAGMWIVLRITRGGRPGARWLR